MPICANVGVWTCARAFSTDTITLPRRIGHASMCAPAGSGGTGLIKHAWPSVPQAPLGKIPHALVSLNVPQALLLTPSPIYVILVVQLRATNTVTLQPTNACLCAQPSHPCMHRTMAEYV